MKTYNLNLKALILILVLTLTGQSYAHRNFALADEKKVVKVNMKAPLIKFITNTLEITSDDLENLKVQLREANFFLINNDNMELQLTLIDSENSDSFLFIEYGNDDNKLEDWMFEDDYLSSETAPAIEDWMFEDDYLSSETPPAIEGWMFEDDYLNTETPPAIEDWMMDEAYYE